VDDRIANVLYHIYISHLTQLISPQMGPKGGVHGVEKSLDTNINDSYM